MKRASQHRTPEKQSSKRRWLWILLLVVGILVGGGIVLALLVWILSNIPFIAW